MKITTSQTMIIKMTMRARSKSQPVRCYRPLSLYATGSLLCSIIILLFSSQLCLSQFVLVGPEMNSVLDSDVDLANQIASGSIGLLGNPQFEPMIVIPNEEYHGNVSLDVGEKSNKIATKRFIESMTTRCFGSAILDDPKYYAPIFNMFKPGLDSKVRATSSPQEILAAGFQPDKYTYIFVHGFTQSYPDTVWLRRARALFERNLLTSEFNCIIMDWSKGAGQTYSQSAAIVSSIGSYLSLFIQKLLELGLAREKIHIIGHSLGAHVSGFAGKRIRPRIGRITGLDMAGPCFGKVASNGPTDRLTPDDAIQVDVYHFDDNFLGIGPGQYGQHDIYVNGGANQPGCQTQANAMFNAALTIILHRDRVLSESHTRSTDVATSDLSKSQCQQVAYSCKSWAAFTQGECGHCDERNSQCFFMGFPFQYGRGPGGQPPQPMPLQPTFPGKRYYVATGADFSTGLCQQHYQVIVKLEQTPEVKNDPSLTIRLDLYNELAGKVNMTLTNRMSPGVFSYLLLLDGPAVKFTSGNIKVDHMSLLAPVLMPISFNALDLAHAAPIPITAANGLKLLQVEINFMSHIGPEVRRQRSSTLCVNRNAPPPQLRPGDEDPGLPLTECQGSRGSLI